MSSNFVKPENWYLFLWAWLGWRKVTAANRKAFETYSALLNEAASMNGYRDAGDAWRRMYGNTNMHATSERLFKQIEPLYQHLHAYVRRHLFEKYERNKKLFEETGHIPAHILGSMWAQNWQSLEKYVRPFPDNHLRSTDINRVMEFKGYTAAKMYLLVEELFTSVGLGPMPKHVWENSVFEKLDDRDMQCYPLAWDLKTGDDFRIRLCTRISLSFFLKMHSLMGQIAYFIQYKNLPLQYRNGANPAFLEGAGQSFSVSARSFEYLQHLGLTGYPEAKGSDINLLMFHALEEVALFPYGVIHDKWLWSVFSGETKEDRYNRKWWELRCRYQGVLPPYLRTENNFDPGSKYSFLSTKPFIFNSLSIVLQYQFHKAMCEAAGKKGPLHRCNVFGSKRAGDKMAAMMRLGSSKPWEDAMEALTGQREMDAGPLLEYYQPLYDWLKEQNKGNPVGWDKTCSDYAVPSVGARPYFTLGVLMVLPPVWVKLF